MKTKTKTNVSAAHSFLLSGSAHVILSDGLRCFVTYELQPVMNTESCIGMLAPTFSCLIDLIIAERYVALTIGPDQIIEIDVACPNEPDGTAGFTCRNPLIRVGLDSTSHGE